MCLLCRVFYLTSPCRKPIYCTLLRHADVRDNQYVCSCCIIAPIPPFYPSPTHPAAPPLAVQSSLVPPLPSFFTPVHPLSLPFLNGCYELRKGQGRVKGSGSRFI